MNTHQIELIHALPERQWRVFIEYQPGMTLIQAWQLSGLEQLFPSQEQMFAVSGSIINNPNNHKLEKDDRVHTIRRVIADPGAMRRKRATKV